MRRNVKIDKNIIANNKKIEQCKYAFFQKMTSSIRLLIWLLTFEETDLVIIFKTWSSKAIGKSRSSQSKMNEVKANKALFTHTQASVMERTQMAKNGIFPIHILKLEGPMIHVGVRNNGNRVTKVTDFYSTSFSFQKKLQTKFGLKNFAILTLSQLIWKVSSSTKLIELNGMTYLFWDGILLNYLPTFVFCHVNRNLLNIFSHQLTNFWKLC